MHICPYLYICICARIHISYIYNVCTRFFSRYLSSHIMINTWFKYIVILCPDNSDNCPACSICGRDGSWHHFYLSVLNILHEECSNKANWPQHKNVFHVIPHSHSPHLKEQAFKTLVEIVETFRYSDVKALRDHSSIFFILLYYTWRPLSLEHSRLAAKRQLWERSGAFFTPWLGCTLGMQRSSSWEKNDTCMIRWSVTNRKAC